MFDTGRSSSKEQIKTEEMGDSTQRSMLEQINDMYQPKEMRIQITDSNLV